MIYLPVATIEITLQHLIILHPLVEIPHQKDLVVAQHLDAVQVLRE